MHKVTPIRTLDRSYKSAINILHGRRRPERPTAGPGGQTPGSIPEAKGKPDIRGIPSIVGMRQWLHEIGHSTTDVDKLNIVHVAGTKGKGSTCAFIEVFLRTFGERTGFPRKTGLYTSPHLIYPEERIRINFQPIGRDLFAKYFFEVWEVLSKDDGTSRTLPRYLQLMALVSFHAFIKEGVDAAIFETHHGGEYDATNIIEHPVATVVTTLGMDHVKQLGPTLENIAWHKAGIFKEGAHAFSSIQEDSAAEVLRARASEKHTTVQFVENDPSLPLDSPQMKPDVQRMNSSVALAVARHFLEEKAPKDGMPLSSSDISRAVDRFSWPGRFQRIEEGMFTWYLDGAHNDMSISKAAEWFIETTKDQSAPHERILIFSQITEQRDATVVLERLASTLSTIRIHHVIFTIYDPQQDFSSTSAVASNSEVKPQEIFVDIWKKYQPESHVLCEPNVQAALKSARQIGEKAGGMHTLITGSQHLVGAVLFAFNHDKPQP
ncbi:folylpolyglutamate synthase [Paraphoma chrysanthemicola]|uniref:tetrahydrofolate synthase n=1 Tax=Paraphoma chrysanthemicola TaxID=798071 RepID=A0A8K0R105_9PLEO|nr:folylpolyglutamate synthase [Paraphoma chrysanthemicola]